ncbi:MAG TPA: CRTAC1 family protein [Acidimicrobiia bacterium]|nr:CRTAC1 family protein [Acidimicrobiia bacterium]
MSSERRGGRLSAALWPLAGMAVGAAVTIGVILAASELFASGELEALGPPSFVEESPTSGIGHVYDGGFRFFVGGGVAVFDCDADRRPDLFFAGGAGPAGLYRNESDVGGELRFQPVSDPVIEMTEVTGAYPLDVDSDGRIDLAVLRVGENVMLRGLGDCRFEPANDIWGIDGGDEWTAAFSATWEAAEELPTLAFGNYLALTDDSEQTGTCSDHYLLRPTETGFADPTTLAPGWCTLSILFNDWSGTGRRDLRMTNDRHYYRDGEEQLWRVEKEQPPSLYGRDDGWERMQIWGMGIASHDVTGDGLPEVFLTSQGDNKLQTLADGGDRPTYEDIALETGANAHRPFTGDTSRPSTAWHAEFDDVNNDGLIDLFVTKGNVEAMPEFAMEDPNNLLVGQPGGTFIEGADAAGLLDYGRSRGGAVADLNLDGLLDVVVVERREPVRIWRNVGGGDAARPEMMGNWLAVDIEQPAPNVDGVGAWIEVRTDHGLTGREVTVGGGHAGGQAGWVHFGLGREGEAEVRIRWPDGITGPWMTVETNQFLIVQRGSSSPLAWSPLQD